MNRKGIGFPSITTLFVLVLVIVVLAAAQNGVDTKTINKTIETLNWTTIGTNATTSVHNMGMESKEYYMQVIFFSVEKGIDFMGYTMFAVSKLAMQLARDNPNIINYRVLLAIIIIGLLAPAIYYGFLGLIVIILLINEWRLNRKEKKFYDTAKKEVKK